MGHRETLLSLPATLDQLTPNCSPMTRASVRRSTASFKSASGQHSFGAKQESFFGSSRRRKMITKSDDERFQKGAQDYAAYIESPEGRLRADLAFANLEDFLAPPKAQKPMYALDVGCGTGA